MIDSTFPALNALDGFLANWISSVLRVCLWGAISGGSALALYAFASDQAGITRMKQEIKKLRSRMLDLQMENSEFRCLVRSNLIASFHLLYKVGAPSLLSSLPVLILVFWLDAFYSYALPPVDSTVNVEILPSKEGINVLPEEAFSFKEGTIRLIVGGIAEDIRFMDAGGELYGGNPQRNLVSSIYKKQWWNALIENNAGYIRPDSFIEEIRFEFPRKVFIEDVPEWLATWEFPFFLSVFIVALTIKIGFRIE